MLIPFKKKTKAHVIKAYNEQMLVTVDDNIYELREISTHQKYSVSFMEQTKEENKEKKIYIPPMSHPWKQASFNAYLARMKHRETVSS